MRSRPALLVHPWFTGAVMVLAVNDHVLKDRWPGLVTGKLSDVAGVVVVAVLASCLVGWRAGAAATVIGFVALKTMSGVASSDGALSNSSFLPSLFPSRTRVAQLCSRAYTCRVFLR